MDTKHKSHFEAERPDDGRLQHMHGTEIVTPFITEDGRDLGVLGRNFYPSFSLSRISLHTENPYSVGLKISGMSKCVVLADAVDGQGMVFGTSLARHAIEGGRQLLLNICSPQDGVTYDLGPGAGVKMRMVGLLHSQIYRLTERYPERLEHFWRMLEGFEDDRAVDALHTPLQQNCLNAIFAQPVMGNMTEEVVNDQIATFLSSLGPRPISPAMQKIRHLDSLRGKMDDVKQLIDQNPSVAFSLQELAAAVGINENYLKAAFQHSYGQSVFSYIFESRMQLACRLLRDTDLSVESIAAAVGYREGQTFHPAFRRRFGITPIAYRLAARNKR